MLRETNIPDEILQRAIARLVRDGKAIHTLNRHGEPSVKLLKAVRYDPRLLPVVTNA